MTGFFINLRVPGQGVEASSGAWQAVRGGHGSVPGGKHPIGFLDDLAHPAVLDAGHDLFLGHPRVARSGLSHFSVS